MGCLEPFCHPESTKNQLKTFWLFNCGGSETKRMTSALPQKKSLVFLLCGLSQPSSPFTGRWSGCCFSLAKVSYFDWMTYLINKTLILTQKNRERLKLSPQEVKMKAFVHFYPVQLRAWRCLRQLSVFSCQLTACVGLGDSTDRWSKRGSSSHGFAT